MSGLRPTDIAEFYRSLAQRGLSSGKLAEKLGVSGGAIRKLVGGFKPRRGPIWMGLLGLLEPKEKELLFRVEQDATWNKFRRSKMPKFTPEKAAAIAAARERNAAV